jgi:hypothetical protein
VLLTIPIRVYAQMPAVTVLEFATADPPAVWNNVTLIADAFEIDEQYKWLAFDDWKLGTYSNLPDGVANAWNDPYVIENDPDPASDPPYDDLGWIFVINKIIQPGTSLKMCMQFDNNSTLQRCEYEAVATDLKGYPYFPGAILEVDFGFANNTRQ